MSGHPNIAPDNDDALESYLNLADSEAEVREMIGFLILHRQDLRDDALLALEKETEKLLEQLDMVSREKLVVELRCFKTVLRLQRRLVQERADSNRVCGANCMGSEEETSPGTVAPETICVREPITGQGGQRTTR